MDSVAAHQCHLVQGGLGRLFEKDATKDDKFFLTAGQDVQTPFMWRKDYYRYFEDSELQMLELPYKGRELSMIAILPRQVNGIDNLEKGLKAARFTKA